MMSLQIINLKSLLVCFAVAIATPPAFADDWRLQASAPAYRLQNNGFDSFNQDSLSRKPDKYADNPQVDADGVRHFANGKHFDLSKMSLDDAIAQTNASTLGAGKNDRINNNLDNNNSDSLTTAMSISRHHTIMPGDAHKFRLSIRVMDDSKTTRLKTTWLEIMRLKTTWLEIMRLKTT